MTTLCAAPRHGEDEVETETHSHLCQPCRLDLGRDLRRLPRLHAELQEPPMRGEGDGGGLPFSEPAMACREQIAHDLEWWCIHITKLRGKDAPSVPDVPWAWKDDGYVMRLVPPVTLTAGWLAPQVTWCSFRDWAPDMAGAISADRQQAAALLSPFVKRQFEIPGPDGICLHCEARVAVTVYASDGDRRRSFIGCPGCGQRWEPEQWMSYGRQVLRRREALAS